MSEFERPDFTPKPRPGNDSGIERGVAPRTFPGGPDLPTLFQRLTLAFAAFAIAATPAIGAAPAKKPPAKAAAKPAPKAAPKPVPPPALPDTPEIAELRRAFRFAFPIYEVLRTRTLQLARAEKAGVPNAVNILLPKTTLVTASDRDVTTPNNDTLYASAWLDLSGGPQILTVPGLPARYNSAALMSLTTDNTAILGTRTGGNGGRYMIVGPGWKGDLPQGAELVRSATNDAWLLVRVVVNGEKDLETATKSLAGFTLAPADGDAAPMPMMAAPPNPGGKIFLTAVNEALLRSIANPDLTAHAGEFAALGIGTTPTPEQEALWTKWLPSLRAELKAGLADAGETVNGWSYPAMAIGDFGKDDDLRSYVALGGLAALPRIEAMYLTARTDKDGLPLTGAKSWRVKLPPRMPIGAFWSLTMYEATPDGRLFFVPNQLDRYAIGDRSYHLRPERDGSYEIFVQNAMPQGERVVNWLPAPKGKFVLVFRAYLPREQMLDGSFRLPPVEEGEVIP